VLRRRREWEREREKKNEDRCCCVCEYLMMMSIEMRYEKKRLLRRKEGREGEGNTSAMFARRCLIVHPVWLYTCVFTRRRNRTNVMCARDVLLNLIV